uniref:Ovule protein n=1 Tax=Echinococcus canadensis TaxID=519352 RepID=A0A915EYM2_9CEST
TSFYLQCNCTLLPLFLLLDVIQVKRVSLFKQTTNALVKAKIIILKFYSKMTSFNHTKTEGSNLPILR